MKVGITVSDDLSFDVNYLIGCIEETLGIERVDAEEAFAQNDIVIGFGISDLNLITKKFLYLHLGNQVELDFCRSKINHGISFFPTSAFNGISYSVIHPYIQSNFLCEYRSNNCQCFGLIYESDDQIRHALRILDYLPSWKMKVLSDKEIDISHDRVVVDHLGNLGKSFSDISVYLNLFEPISIGSIFALKCNVPVVSTNYGLFKEILKELPFWFQVDGLNPAKTALNIITADCNRNLDFYKKMHEKFNHEDFKNEFLRILEL